MDIALKFKSHSVCICPNAFLTEFFCKITFMSNFSESVDLQKISFNFTIFKKNQKNFHGLGQDIFCIKFLVVSDFEAFK